MLSRHCCVYFYFVTFGVYIDIEKKKISMKFAILETQFTNFLTKIYSPPIMNLSDDKGSYTHKILPDVDIF